MPKTDRDRLLNLAKRRGVITAREVVRAGIHSQQLTRLVAESINLTLVPLPGVRVEIVGVAINVGETSPVVFDGSINLSARLVHGCRALHPVDLVGESSLKFEPVPLCFVEMTTFDQIDDAVREPFE
jgi:hypothetical protein